MAVLGVALRSGAVDVPAAALTFSAGPEGAGAAVDVRRRPSSSSPDGSTVLLFIPLHLFQLR